jgi:hypothetical protein
MRTNSFYNQDMKLYNYLYNYRDVNINDDDNIVDKIISEDAETRLDNDEESNALDANQDVDETDDTGEEDVVFMPDY